MYLLNFYILYYIDESETNKKKNITYEKMTFVIEYTRKTPE